jgi:colanic acid biosynthesis glycosyl transferase WcaI
MLKFESHQILVCCQVFYPDQQSTSQLLSSVMMQLSVRGAALTVLSGFPSVVAIYSQRTYAREMWEGIRIRRLGLRGNVKSGLIARSLSYSSYSFEVIWCLLVARRWSRVLLVTNPPFLPLIGVFIGLLRRHRVKVILQDIYPDGLVAVGAIKAEGLVDRLWAGANRWAFRRSQEVWVLGRDMAELVQARYGVAASRVRVVPHWSPIEFQRRSSPENSQLWGSQALGGKFVVQYSGNMGLWHDLVSVVRAAALLRDDLRIVFLLIGSGRGRASAEAEALRLGLQNVRWLPYQPREALADSLACCQVALISQRAGLEGVAVPCKLYGILASGRAVVAQVPARSEVARVVEEERCGVVVPPADAGALAREIRRLAQAPEEVERMGERAFAAYREKYTLEAGVRAFEAGFKDWGENESSAVAAASSRVL